MKKYNFHDLRQQYEDLQKQIENLGSHYKLTSLSEEDKTIINDKLDALAQPSFNILFVGAANSDKISMINALLEKEKNILPFDNEVLNDKVTTIRASEVEKSYIEIFFTDGASKQLLLNALDEFETTDNIESISVFITDFPFDKDIALINTPNQDVDMTINYLQEAHACVFCFELEDMAASSQTVIGQLLTDNALQNLGIDTKDIFWVINNWNIKDNSTKKQTLEGFLNLIKSNNLKIDTKKVYTLSANAYLTSRLSVPETSIVSSKTKEKNTKTFKKFKKDLFSFITTQTKANFYTEVHQQLQAFEQKVLKELKPLFKQNVNVEDEFRQKMDELKFKKSRKIDIDIKKLITSQHSEFFRNKDGFWNEERKAMIKTALEDTIKTHFYNIGVNFKVVEYIIYNNIDIGAQTLVPAIPKILIGALESQIRTFIYDGYCFPLVDEIKKKIAQYNLEDIERELDDTCNLNYLNYRVRGFFDSVLHDYTRKVAGIVQTELTNKDSSTTTYLGNIEQNIVTYLQETVDSLKVEHLINNCFADIIKKLECIDYQGSIFPRIENGGLDFKEATQKAIIARKEIKSVYEMVNKAYKSRF